MPPVELTYGIGEVSQVAEQIVKQLVYPVCTLQGEMGTGKTTLLREVCKQLGVEGEVNSPSYSLVNEYLTEDGERIYHFDLYRIKTEIELFDMGFSEYLSGKDRCFIEWPQIALNHLPYHYHTLLLEHRTADTRSLRFN